jgi:hypothetical protein
LVAKAVLQHVRSGGDVDGHVEEVGHFAAETGEIDEPASWLQLDEEVEVASGGGFAAGGRSVSGEVPI